MLETEAFAAEHKTGLQAVKKRPSGAKKQRRRNIVAQRTGRRLLVRKYMQEKRINSQKDLCRHFGIDPSALQGMFRGDTARYSEYALGKFLKNIDVSRKEWDRK